VLWNTDNSLKGLYYGNDKNYGGELPEGCAEWHEYTVCNYDTGCGQWGTLLLNNEKQISVEELEEMFDCDVC